MEMSLMGQQTPGLAKRELLLPILRPRGSSRRQSTDRVGFGIAAGEQRKNVVLRAVSARSELVAAEKFSSLPNSKEVRPIELYVGLPLDVVTDGKTVNHPRAIAAGLKALKLLGVDGVELPIFWGVAQPEVDSTNFSAYLDVARIVSEAGLPLRVSLHLCGSRNPAIPLPKFVSRAAEADRDILFTDRAGNRRDDCLSFAVDELPVLDGRTPIQAYLDFFHSFCTAFSDLLGSTVTDITIGLGPEGELRYPSYPPSSTSSKFNGVGEFQCYDKYMLAELKKHAEASGNPLWGLTGPHDAPEYSQSHDSANFFNENGGSWRTPYGDFFLSWYAKQLIAHGDRILDAASDVFGNLHVKLSAKVPLIHSWHNTSSRPAQATAGFYNTCGRDGYDPVAEMFSKHNCTMIIPGMDLSDSNFSQDVRASPESLLAQIMAACQKHGVRVGGENTFLPSRSNGISSIKAKLSADNSSVVDYFTYQRMGAQFFSPEHFPIFTEFVRSLAGPELHADDVARNDEAGVSSRMRTLRGNNREMQAV